MIDEIDYLYQKDENVLYSLFEWTHQPESKLIVVGIANTMELPAMLGTKTLSRMGKKRLTFRAYNQQEIQAIVESRLEETKIFAPEALRFCAMKLSKFSSDIRRIKHIII